jgi:rhodanese-related sulfurtransferase
MNSTLSTKEQVLETATLGNRKFEIVFGGEGIGFYVYVFEGGRCTHDYLQDTVELAKSFAEEEFKVTINSWKKKEILGAESPMSAVLENFPGAQRALFRRYHIGGCSSCGFSPDETLAQVCARNGNLDVAEVLAHIQSSHEQDAKVLISPKQLAELIQKDKTVKLVDVRSREEFEAVNIAGSVLLSQDVMRELMASGSNTNPIVVIDHAGKNGLDAAAYFMGHGLQNVRCLRGGIDAWAQEIEPKMRRYKLG